MIKERIKENQIYWQRASKSTFVRAGGFLLLGFACGTGNALEDLHPFGIALTVVSGKKYLLFSAVGAALGAIVGGINAYTMRYLAGIALAALGAFAVATFRVRHQCLVAMALALTATLVSGIVLYQRMQLPAAAYLLLCGESILSSGAAFFFYRALHANYRRLRLRALPVSDITCLLISLCILLMNLSALQVGIFVPVRCIAVTLVLITLRYFGERWGMIAALCSGFIFSLNGGDTLFMAGAFSVSAMMSALFAPLAGAGIGIAFFLSMTFFCIASGSATALPLFLESGMGVLLFWMMPSRLTAWLEQRSDASREQHYDGSLRQSLVLKLRFASGAMAAISESVEQVREKINEIARRENETSRTSLTEEEYLRRELILEKTNQIRMVASEQFFSIADMLEDLAFEFDEAEIFDAAASAKIRRLLGEHDIYPSNISVIEDKYARMRVEILTERADGLDNPQLAREIGKICSRYFENGRITNFKNETMLSFFEKPHYRLSIGFAQHCAEGHLCGDTVKTIHDGKGHAILIISDGMGKGSRAALDGAMGAGLLARLIHAGFGFDSALKVVNCALLVKSNEESLATLDIANIDLFTGKCELFKAGAPASYISKNGTLTKCELSSMPAGILRGIEFAKRTAVLQLEDSVFLISDGFFELGEAWVERELHMIASLPSQAAAEQFLADAKIACLHQKTDDMSIICAKLLRN